MTYMRKARETNKNVQKWFWCTRRNKPMSFPKKTEGK